MNAIKNLFKTSGKRSRFVILDKLATIEIVIIIYTLSIFLYFQLSIFDLQQASEQMGAKGFSYPQSLVSKNESYVEACIGITVIGLLLFLRYSWNTYKAGIPRATNFKHASIFLILFGVMLSFIGNYKMFSNYMPPNNATNNPSQFSPQLGINMFNIGNTESIMKAGIGMGWAGVVCLFLSHLFSIVLNRGSKQVAPS